MLAGMERPLRRKGSDVPLEHRVGDLVRIVLNRVDAAMVADGGRVLRIAATGKTLRAARFAAYAAVDALD
jgi:phosphoribosylamine-glycine ligase